jgi:hypothetical protein
VVLDTLGTFASYGPGLAAVVVLDDSFSRPASILGGVIVLLLAYSLAHYALFQKMPRLGFGIRPYRYSLPNGIGLFAASWVYWLGLDAATTFAVAIPLLIAGHNLSQLWWSLAARNVSTAHA